MAVDRSRCEQPLSEWEEQDKINMIRVHFKGRYEREINAVAYLSLCKSFAFFVYFKILNSSWLSSLRFEDFSVFIEHLKFPMKCIFHRPFIPMPSCCDGCLSPVTLFIRNKVI